VLGHELDDLVAPVAGALLDHRSDLVVLAGPNGLGEHPVGDVANQHVLERQLALARQPPLGAGDENFLLLEREERALELAAARARDRGERALEERAPGDGRVLDEPALGRLERVEAGGEDRLDRVRQLGLRHRPLLRDPSRHLLGEQRVAAGALDDGAEHRLAVGQQGRDERVRVLDAERVEQELGRRASTTAPARPAVEQLVAGEADDHERGANPLGEVLDGVEHAVVGPVDVLERDHERTPRRDRLDPAPQRR
jgi:hypothetical protein